MKIWGLYVLLRSLKGMSVLSFILGQYTISRKVNSFANGRIGGKGSSIVRQSGGAIAQKFSDKNHRSQC